MNVTSARPVTEASQVAEGRRLVLWLASRLEFSEERAGQAALIASELGTNLAKHARGGELLVRPLSTADGDLAGIEVLSLDKGPGMPETALARRDGYSTTGTLGHGLGAIQRQADQLDIYTHTTGTAIAARIWRERPPADTGQSRFEVGAVHVSHPTEEVCGDDWGWRQRNGRLTISWPTGWATACTPTMRPRRRSACSRRSTNRPRDC
jgi:anti-sigma regulatory factor (Ser/Thr protein kinase)